MFSVQSLFAAGIGCALLAAVSGVTPSLAGEAQAAVMGPSGLPLPRFVSLKTNEGNARRGPGLTHRIDWVFTRAGMPLRVTAEYENWRRIEDAEGAGGWVHYTMLSGSRTVLVMQDMVNVLDAPDDAARVAFQAEAGVVGRVQECSTDWCRIGVDGNRGWLRKAALWGVEAGELVD